MLHREMMTFFWLTTAELVGHSVQIRELES
jgi:hypothetical protein